jgi:hypothetical protein
MGSIEERAAMEHGTCPNCGTSYVVTSKDPLNAVTEWLDKAKTMSTDTELALRDLNGRMVDLQKEVRAITEALTEFTPLARRAAKLFDNSRVIKIREALNGKGSIKRPNS